MQNKNKIKILLVDDHQIFLDGLTSLFASERTIEKIGEAHNGKEALEILDKINVDVVVLDINMPIMDGIITAEIIREKYPNIKILVLTMTTDGNVIHKVIQAGVLGYVIKNIGKDDLINAIHKVNDGIGYFPEEINKILISNIRNSNRIAKLTKREIEVLKLIADGFRTKEIANRLSIAVSTVEVHRRNLMEKTNATNSQSLVKYAIDNGLI